jgi:outer membrane protein OmpA-like peptidoglycan-associated protein
MRNSTSLLARSVLTAAAALSAVSMGIAQESLTPEQDHANWRFGVYGGLNGNFVGTGEQTLGDVSGNAQFGQRHTNGGQDIIDGSALGFYAGLMTEYAPLSLLGFQLRAGLDDRRVNFNDWDVPDPSQAIRFSARMTYVSVEPLLRLNLVSPNFHLTAGPLLSFKINSTYDFVGRDEVDSFNIVGQEIPGANAFAYGVSGGLAYDIPMNSKSTSRTRWYLTPFAEASYMMDQREAAERTDNTDRNDVWVTTTIRGGFQLKFGNTPAPVAVVAVADDTPNMDLSLRAPSAITEERRVTEWFPLRNYIFFNQPGDVTVPAKYTKLSTTDAAAFDERTLLNPPVTGTSTTTMSRSQRQMGVYYNALNIYADRLRDNAGSTITLTGAAPTAAAGQAQAQAVKDYMVSTFGLDAARINVKGAVRPPHASGDRDTPNEDLDLVREENLRVEVASDNNAILKPVEIQAIQTEPIDNDLALNVRANGPVQSWMVTITGNGFNQTYGPYSGSAQRIDAKPILGTNASGEYTANVTATMANGQTITRSQSFSLVRRELPPVTGQRYSILFEFDDSRTVQTYDQFLRAEVAPRIPTGSTIVVHGHTDRVGMEDYNLELSNRRAQEARRVLEDELKKLGKTATFDSYGFGETEQRAPFGNESPEGRYYNRTVLIEVIPGS